MQFFIKIRQFFVTFLFILTFSKTLNANVDLGNHGTGMKLPTAEHIQQIEKHWPQIIGIRPNKIGAARIESHLKSKFSSLKVVAAEEEFITNKNANAHLLQAYFGALPPYVDNSTLPSFPPIGDQGAEGSCVGFASTYYQTTHEIGLVNGYNNKTSAAHILSPKWTYNMINGGADNGAYPVDAYVLLSQNGAPSIQNLPYIVGDVRTWDLKTQDWIDAMSNRTGAPLFVTGIGGSSQDLTQIKQLLNNGHVLTFATFISSWQFSQIKQNPNPGADNRFVGQYAANWMQGTQGGHFTTIVGYNDNLWIDINGNGQVDPGEMGAFLVANSWGNWGNNGFIWVSYDAFLTHSAVPNGPSIGRVAMASALNNYVVTVTAKTPNYKPTLVAQVGLTAQERSQINISGGVSTMSEKMPTQLFTSGAIHYQGGPYSFDGTTTAKTGIFALDLTDLVDPKNPSNNRFYLLANDNQTGNPTTVESYSLIDYVQGTTTQAPNLPQSADNNTLYLYIDHGTTPPPPPPPQNPTVTITAPANNATVSCSMPIAVTVTNNVYPISVIALYVDNALFAVDQSAPYTFLLDTTKLTNGLHTLTATATDSSNNLGKSSITIQVHNGCN